LIFHLQRGKANSDGKDFRAIAGAPSESEKAMRDFYAALKPDDIFAVEQHRADPRPMKPGAGRDGYMSTAVVV
jgi:predicted methyltransferase